MCMSVTGSWMRGRGGWAGCRARGGGGPGAGWGGGAAPLPLDPGYPPGRLAFLLADSGAGVVVAAPGLDAGQDDAVQLIVLDGRLPGVAPLPATPLRAGAGGGVGW